MAKRAFLCLFFSSLLIICTSAATLVGFSYHERGDTASSESAGALSFLKQNKISPSQIRMFVTDHRILNTLTISNVSVDFYLNYTLLEQFANSQLSAVSWLKTHLANLLPQVDIRSIVASCGRECLGQNEIPFFVSALKSLHSALNKLQRDREVKVSVAFSLSSLEKFGKSNDNDLFRVLSFLKEMNSFVMIEDSIDGQTRMEDQFVHSIIKRAVLAASLLPSKDVPIVLTIKSQAIPTSIELSQFSDKVSKYLLEAGTQITGRMVALYAEVHKPEDFAQKELKRESEEIFPLSRREILSKLHIRRTLDDTTNSPTRVFPTNPVLTTPVSTPPDTPTIITIPATNPVTVSPTNPAATPVTVPSTTPVPLPPTNPANSPVPITNPVTTPISVPPPPVSVPVTNPVSSYPPPAPSVPVTNPVAPPANTNAPAISGQRWCVVKTGVSQTALQSALDYACGMGGADCSQIQQGGSCYNPNSLQNHASYAFNSYYQKNPAPTSCDFGGTATLVNTNPSTGSCIYPSSSSSPTPPTSSTPTQTPPTSSTPTQTPPTSTTPIQTPPTSTTPAQTPPTSTTPTQTPPTSTPPTPTAPTTSTGTGTFGYGTPPSVLNSSNPASGTTPVFGSDSPPVVNTTSNSAGLRPSVSCIILVLSLVARKLSIVL